MDQTYEKLLCIKEVAAILGVSRDAVVRLIKNGHIRAVEFPTMGGRGKNKKKMIAESEVHRFLSDNVTRRKAA
jgi:excisionase family DNA binding protein